MKIHLIPLLLFTFLCIIGSKKSIYPQNTSTKGVAINVQNKQKRDPQQFLLSKLDNGMNYPNGLYTGKISIQFRNGKKDKHYMFKLYIKERNRLYYFTNNTGDLILKLLYYTNPKIEMLIKSWDPLRRKSTRTSKENCFKPVLQTGFSYWDLALFSYDKIYHSESPLNNVKSKSLIYNREKGKNTLSFPDNLLEYTQKGFITLSLRPKFGSSFFLNIKMRIHEKKMETVHMDFYSYPSLLRKSVYLLKDKSIYNHNQKKNGKVPFPTKMNSLDFMKETLSRFQLETYEPRAKIKLSLFSSYFFQN